MNIEGPKGLVGIVMRDMDDGMALVGATGVAVMYVNGPVHTLNQIHVALLRAANLGDSVAEVHVPRHTYEGLCEDARNKALPDGNGVTYGREDAPVGLEKVADLKNAPRFKYSPPKAKVDLSIRCKICNHPAPWDETLHSGASLEMGRQNTHGWMHTIFPFRDDNDYSYIREVSYLCPKDGKKVAEYVAHLQTPMIGDEDLL